MRQAHRPRPPRGDAGSPPLHRLRLQALSAARARHLARRFFGALGTAGPAAEDEAWVESILGSGTALHAVWHRLSGPDRRHAVAVARAVAEDLAGSVTPAVLAAVLAAALLHDAGKVEAGLGTWARVPATVIGELGGRRRAARWAGADDIGRRAGGSRGWRRRLGLYLTHPEVGAALLETAGADPLTVAWAREHHLPPARWTLPTRIAAALKTADDD